MDRNFEIALLSDLVGVAVIGGRRLGCARLDDVSQ
jgi:hypothetical protein